MFKCSELCARLLHRNVGDINSLPEILSASFKQVLKSPSPPSIPWSRLPFVRTEKGNRDAGRWGTCRAYSFKSGPWGATIKMRGPTFALDGEHGCRRERSMQQPNHGHGRSGGHTWTTVSVVYARTRALMHGFRGSFPRRQRRRTIPNGITWTLPRRHRDPFVLLLPFGFNLRTMTRKFSERARIHVRCVPF